MRDTPWVRPTVLLVVALLICSTVEAQDLPFTISGTTSVELSLRSGDMSAPSVTSDATSISRTERGRESNVCAPDAKRSEVEGAVAAQVGAPSAGTLPLNINVAARAVGGATSPCEDCVVPCAAVSSVRTAATVVAKAKARLRIAFSKESVDEPFGIQLEGTERSSSPTPQFRFRVLDASGNELGGGIRLGNRPIVISSSPGATFDVEFEAVVDAEDVGGCCEQRAFLNVDARLAVRPAPLLASQTGTEFIIGGKETDRFKEVGAILANQQMNCTGTLIGRKVVLTAAHCVDRWAPGELLFVLGTTANLTGATAVEVENLVYPRGEAGFRFNRAMRTDDVALLFLKTAVTDVDPVPLYEGTPDLVSCCSRTPPTFVGFGYGDENRSQAGQGVKRLALIPVRDWNAKEFTVADTAQQVNTCKGDSGGPAFLVQQTQHKLLGVVSWGDPKCREYGVNMRVDGYTRWIRHWIR